MRVVVLGRGGAGKSSFARELGRRTGVPVVELDAHFWSAGLEPLDRRAWTARQADLVAGESWILDGDLGPYDVPDVRLRRADTVVLLDLHLLRCAWRAFRRSREAADFWSWVWHYRRRHRPLLLAAVRAHAPAAALHRPTTPRQVRRLLAELGRGGGS